MIKTPSPTLDAQYSVLALHLLAEVLAPLLDIVFGNDEKDRVRTGKRRRGERREESESSEKWRARKKRKEAAAV